MHLTPPSAGLQFLGDGRSHRQALHAAENTLDLALAPTHNAPSPPATYTAPSQSGAREATPPTDIPANATPPADTAVNTPADVRKNQQHAINTVALDTPLGNFEDALAELNQLWLSHAVRYDSPRYLAHLNCPITPASFAGAIISAGVNTAVESWDQSRGAALIEDRLVRWAAQLAGMNPKQATGVFTSGGTQSNLQALYTAREKALAEGASLSELCVLCSPEAHHSIARAAHLLGLSTQVIPTAHGNPNAGMDLDALRQAITNINAASGVGATDGISDTRNAPANRGVASDEVGGDSSSPGTEHHSTPRIACLVLTAGTTDLGAIDPLDNALRIAEEHGIYVHVDCAYGGALLLSKDPQRRALLTGLERANSFSLDFHKSFFQPLSCSALIYRDQADMDFVTCHADYLNPSEDSRLNLADRSLQTTRRFDALKLWLSLRVEGPQKLGQAFDTCCDIAQATAELICENPELELLTEPTLSTVLFRYVPSAGRNYGVDLGSVDLNYLNEAIRRHLFESNQLIIASTLRDAESYLKFTILNPQISLDDIRYALDIICREGARHSERDFPERGAPTQHSSAHDLPTRDLDDLLKGDPQ